MAPTNRKLQEQEDTAPDADRQSELEQAYQENGNSYAGVQIRSRGELQWVLRQRGWSDDIDALTHSRADLHGIDLVGVELGDVNLNGANLSEAKLGRTSLRGASLFGANLRGTDLRYADLSGTFLPDADLRDADLEHTSLMDARLLNASLGGAYLESTDLSGADLWGARLDATTILRDIRLSGDTMLGDVVWNSVPLTQVDWTQLPRLGDEGFIQEASLRAAKITRRAQRKQAVVEATKAATRAYGALAIALREQGLSDDASRFHLMQRRLERRSARIEGKRGKWLFLSLLNLVSGYGEQPVRALLAYATVISSFAVIYYGVTHYLDTKLSKLSWDEAFVLSLTSFHGRGFFPGTLPLGDWVARFGALEAIIGLFIELVFIATFTRRFLGD